MRLVEGVESVISLANLPNPFDVTGPESRSLEFFEGYFVGVDRQTTAAVCFLLPQPEALARSRTIDELRQIVTQHDPTSVLAGDSISDVLDRLASVDSIVRGDIVASDTAEQEVVAAKVTRGSFALLTARKHALEQQRAAAATRAHGGDRRAGLAALPHRHRWHRHGGG